MTARPLEIDAGEAERRLSLAYEDQLDLFGRALSLAEQLDHALTQGHTHDTSLQQLASVMGEVATIEAGIAETKNAWKQAGFEAGPQLQTTLTLVTRQIEKLSSLMAKAERHGPGQFSLPDELQRALPNPVY